MIQSDIQESLKKAMSSKNTIATSVFRMVLASLKNEQIAKKEELTDAESLSVLKREVKKRDEAIEAYEKAGRTEQAELEREEKKIIQNFLPKEMSQEELSKIIDSVIESAGVEKEFGPLMKKVMEHVQGKADGGRVSQILKQKLT